MRDFLPVTPFRPGSDYDVQVDEHGVWVNSECCGERMGRDTAEKLRDAITAWLAVAS